MTADTLLDYSFLLDLRPSSIIYNRDGFASEVVGAATPRQKFVVKLNVSPTHVILPPGQPVLALTP